MCYNKDMGMKEENREPCIICERPVDITKRHRRFHLIEASGDRGWFAIGSDCARSQNPELVDMFDPLA